MGFYILGYKQPHAAPPGAPRITRSRASPCPPAAPPDPAAAYILGYVDGFQMWRSGSPRRPHSAAPVTPSAPRRLAPPRALRTGRPPAPHLIEATRVSCDLRPLETLAFLCCGTGFGAPEGSVSPVGCWAEGPKRPEGGERNERWARQAPSATIERPGVRPKPRQARRGSVSPVGCWTEGPKRPEAGQRNHERDRQGSAND